ncbi:hypothetical protein MHB77_32430 [Paenibacillus sp. FSL K6-3166]|uniref:hypothetical protein n=1 Tax=unclassified Paenibacillus TaxID=185978 RepID=UPI000BA0DCE3|nr:hypothetical protein [Paenibacillus sp. VTT E-133291]OZQ84691.1 hypothetical protein CA598_23135 [Paenibacillus sp. VTT E-133291]
MQTPQSYVIESIHNLDGTTHERGARRKGQRVEILRCEVGAPMLVCYRDDGNKILRTSFVRSIADSDGVVSVVTSNTVYTFGKEAA